jgi:hypothetical protein
MPKFSDRYGYTSPERAFQRESVDAALRTKLWNALKVAVWDRYPTHDISTQVSQRIDDLVRRLWFHFFNTDLDLLPEFYSRYGNKGSYNTLKDFFFSCEWFELYNFIEEIAEDSSHLLNDGARDLINQVLETHNAAYRLVALQIIEITDKQEIKAIEESLEHAESPVRTHLDAALRMLSDRQSPDYRNSIKESISAVESACRLVCGDKSATLGDALKKVKNLHPALSKAFGLLYGYTSDAEGVRHSLIDEPSITYADAKFMLVACSAFVSYLKLSTNNG